MAVDWCGSQRKQCLLWVGYRHRCLLKRLLHHLNFSLSSVPWSIRPLTTHDVFIFKVRFLAASHMVRGDVSPVFSYSSSSLGSRCVPWLGEGLSMPSPNDRLVLSSAISCRSSICPGRLSTAWLVSLDVFSCHMVSKW